MALPRALRPSPSGRRAGLQLNANDRYRKRAEALLQKRLDRLMPVVPQGRAVSRSVWGQAFCAHIERYSDFENRLPRGRTYLRRGAVLHLEIEAGLITGLVLGHDLYAQRISVEPLDARRARRLAEACAGDIDAVADLISGELPRPVLATLTDRKQGLFPEPEEIELQCSCPDGAYLCKHLAAVLYGIATRLDERPDLLFVLRGIEPDALIERAPELFRKKPPAPERRLQGDLGALFDIDIDAVADAPPGSPDLDSAPADAVDGDAIDDDGPVLVPRALLVSAGLTPGQITSWLRRGLVVRTRERGVYELTPTGWEALEPRLDE